MMTLDPERMFYNTGNSKNTEKRSGMCMAGKNSDLENAPINSLHARFKYFKRKDIKPDFSKLNSPIFEERSFLSNVDSWMIDSTGSKILETKTGLKICKNLFSDELLRRLGEEALFEYTKTEVGRNNLINVGRTLTDKIEQWTSDAILKKNPLKELRWVTLGRHHNWLETIPGSADKASSIPVLLKELGECIGRVLGFSFRLDASIINFYPANNSSIGIHRDDIDYQIAPIMTISLGCSGLFQIGIGERDQEGFEVFLEHGDLCILDGADRSAFHAVPRIISFEEANTEKFKLSGNNELDSYLRQSRINISLRQCKS
ncbi:unnamed protein product [Oikopleura dioica]|uniref:Fe2OG dioxygenase domain-containing protein n=1 Tax=Oikopleura dioica TaxID=34765 RepID=E4X991_OIKDI|nr:unnamed protein product [Oikopleura dioica]